MQSNKKICFVLAILFISSSLAAFTASAHDSSSVPTSAFTIIIDQFRYLEQEQAENARFWVECAVAGERHSSPEWTSDQSGESVDWSIFMDVAPCRRVYNISFFFYKSVGDSTVLCDLSANTSMGARSVEIFYSLDTGWWDGDDAHGDPSGYGRFNGCDDGSIYTFEDDAELVFTIVIDDTDGDNIPQWMETNMYFTDSSVDDSKIDYDNDGIGTTWEWYFGYDPFEPQNHDLLDEDNDSLTNIEEYKTWGFGSDPFRKDIFLEIDYMKESPTGESSLFPEEAESMLHYPFHRRNYVVHINRSDVIPFDEKTDTSELLNYYQSYFLHDESSNWRRGVYHYGLFVYETTPKGFAFSGDVDPHWGYHPGTNGFVISSSRMERNARLFQETLPYYYASATMHEMGHNFGFKWGDPFGCDAQFGKYPWQPAYWIFGNYKSIMNYRYTYKIFDYSDGTHGFLDHDDWGNLDLTYFEYQ